MRVLLTQRKLTSGTGHEQRQVRMERMAFVASTRADGRCEVIEELTRS